MEVKLADGRIYTISHHSIAGKGSTWHCSCGAWGRYYANPTYGELYVLGAKHVARKHRVKK